MDFMPYVRKLKLKCDIIFLQNYADAMHINIWTIDRSRNKAGTTFWKINIFNVKLWVKTQHNFFSVIFNFVRAFPHILRMLEFSEINKKVDELITPSGWIMNGTFLVWNISIASEILNI